MPTCVCERRYRAQSAGFIGKSCVRYHRRQIPYTLGAQTTQIVCKNHRGGALVVEVVERKISALYPAS